MEHNTIFLVLQGITTLCFFFAVFIINGFKYSLDKIQTSVGELNISITKLVEKDLNKDQRLDLQKQMINKNEAEIMQLRERYHENINNSGSKIELMTLELETLKKEIQNISLR